MAIVDEIHVLDNGTKLLMIIKDNGVVVDLSNTSEKEVTFEKPDKTNITRSVDFETDGTDGQVYYVFAADELDQAGIWKFQVRVKFPLGNWRTNIGTFRVYDNIA